MNTGDRLPRQDWEGALQDAGPANEDELLLDGIENQFDRDEWEW